MSVPAAPPAEYSTVEPEAIGDDRKAKKRMQNRVAQRSYRQRMKARVEELQAKVDQLEGTRHGGEPAHDAAFPPRRDSHLGPSFFSAPSSAANMLPPPFDMAPDAPSNNMSLHNVHAQHARQPHFMDAATFQDTQSLTSTATSSISRPDSPPSVSSQTPDFLSSFSAINSPDDSYPSASMASADMPPSSPHASSATSVEARLRYVAEQARFAGFPDLDAMITAYYTVLAGDPSAALGDGDGSAARRLPRLIATLRHAVQEWRDWERKGFPLD
ncbi:hypothetical protein CERZMDRAFT_85388 [Cercospora zeae-maydis SCOH1-5]|uniref:BZIP domain-containing protein n=1 Tax=Cercospora zeae-maydis SCOH1-5 TaxID=717836 RepID=A0A6A6FDZ4_9PEZI|nr:hypothetical protein CERZMDRAFT_85388 [Cercospora zeae-maydis SCOH1-5]